MDSGIRKPSRDAHAVQARPKPNWIFVLYLVTVFGFGLASIPMITTQGVVAFAILYFLSMFGITFGFHRYFTHRSFKLPRAWEYLTAFLGALAFQGGLFTWVANHRMHHAYVETDRDPHSAGKGLFFSHIGWLIFMPMDAIKKENLLPYARDIARDRVLMFMGSIQFELALQIILFLALYLSLGLEVAMWGVFVRILVTFNVTATVNSVGHKYGYRRYDTEDFSTNNWLLGVITLGDGFHNNHHADERCAFHGHKWWELDFAGWMVRLLERLGIATHVKRQTVTSPAPAA